MSAETEAQVLAGAVASELTRDGGLSLRDAAELLGLSHQRVQQLVTQHREEEVLRSRPSRKGAKSSPIGGHR